ncbi:hypothetical protein CAPTEDRAFT_192776 [Capitella teleta]|uniref:mRNA m(6)A methyltransferase n=1 Tax=Capitella teleta TaxID=283909 RepID=R7T3J2_CAPTE|nr:hypothetical protein CAPTEDRAFT_192776 [Capitella teleta]|eukprot:ELT87258.1 hypothetical protein CAPTEDRAFT_192776 [Capitella teleta]
MADSQDTWKEIQAHKSRQLSLREKLAMRKKAREEVVAQVAEIIGEPAALGPPTAKAGKVESRAVEKELLIVLDEATLNLPVNLEALMVEMSKVQTNISPKLIENLLQKFSAQMLIRIVSAVSASLAGVPGQKAPRKRKHEGNESEEVGRKEAKKSHSEPSIEVGEVDVLTSLLLMQSAKERESKKLNEEIVQLLSQPTAKEQSLVEKFKSQGGAQVKEFCQFGTIGECQKINGVNQHCGKLHFKKIIHKHTDESLGDCSFLNTCFHMDTCKYVHYEIAYPEISPKAQPSTISKKTEGTILYPPQWVHCDLRNFDVSVLGKFSVIMADPPWDIHMELPYGTMQDNEMRNLQVPLLQDDGFIFLWVTGRAMELGRECLTLWGYDRVDELIWVKANQLQRIIRTGRTGHWLNHGKEHCLIGMKGNPTNINRGLDCDVIVAEVRATSHKPDEIYGIIERLAPGSRKLELFGRPHNVQPNWITLGNQLDGVKLIDPEVVEAFKKKYPNGYNIVKGKLPPPT